MMYFNVITITDNNLSLGVVQKWEKFLVALLDYKVYNIKPYIGKEGQKFQNTNYFHL